MKRAVVCGAGGMLGTHLVNRLKADGYHVVGLDRKFPEFSKSQADVFDICDLRGGMCGGFEHFHNADEVYQLACEVGGLGYIMNHENDAEMLRNSSLVNLMVVEKARAYGVRRIFYASSACVYSSLPQAINPYTAQRIYSGECLQIKNSCTETDVPPFNADNEYATEKFFSERLYMAYGSTYEIETRIGRLHNVYGPLGTWQGGREKAPAAVCRKVALAKDGDAIEIWGDGTATRSFTYVDDTVEGIIRVMGSDITTPVNIGSSQMVTVNHLVDVVCAAAGKTLTRTYVDGPVGVAARNSDNTFIVERLGWQPELSLQEGIARTYPWIEAQTRLTVDVARM